MLKPQKDKLKDILPAWTYGFEIEGLFNKSLRSRLDNLARTTGAEIEYKTDGSVKGLYAPFKNLSTESEFDGQGTRYCSEITAGAFHNLAGFIAGLSMFDSRTHAHNLTCGLHIHIGAPSNAQRTQILSFKFITSLQRYAQKNLCDCNIERLTTPNRYCHKYRILADAKSKLNNGDKYNFIRNHLDNGTLEMRFFSPCKHKVSNVLKILKQIDAYLRTNPEIKYAEVLPRKAKIDMPVINYPIMASTITESELTHKAPALIDLKSIIAGTFYQPDYVNNPYIVNKARYTRYCGYEDESHEDDCSYCENRNRIYENEGTDDEYSYYEHCACCYNPARN